MNTAAQVDVMLRGWKEQGMEKAETVVRLAEACLSWPYVYGEWGDYCTPTVRRKRANGIAERMPKEAEVIRKGCQVLSGKASKCSGCQFYPGNDMVRCYDCRGFTHWVLLQAAGIDISGQGATSQWNTSANWTEKGTISDIPRDKVCVVFMWDSANKCMSHTGLYVGEGRIIHCSGTVKTGYVSDRGWTHYALVKGLTGVAPAPSYGGSSAPVSNEKPTLRKGARGEYVTLLQTKLIQKGYSLAPYGADGSFGDKTLAAVKAFQKDHGLDADGVVGKKTWEALESGEPAKTYTVVIAGLTKEKADALKAQYPNAEIN